MNTQHPKSDRFLLAIHWAARLLSLVVLGMLMLIFIGDGGFNPLSLTIRESVLMTLLGTAMVGLILAWQWECVGGAINFGSMLLFLASERAFAGHFPSGWALYSLALPGALFLIHATTRTGIRYSSNRFGGLCR